jgi:uncharacterized protein YcbX
MDLEDGAEFGMRDVRIHGSILPQAIDMGPRAEAFISAIVGRPVKMFRANPWRPRYIKEKYQTRGEGAGNQVAAADGQPLLLINRESVAELARMNGKPPGFVAPERFRYNLLTSGFEPFAEDRARRVAFGNWVALGTKLCDRCAIPNIDQDTSEYTGGVTKLLQVRKGTETKVDEAGNEVTEEHVYMGKQFNPLVHPAAIVRVGDQVHVLEWDETTDVVFSK